MCAARDVIHILSSASRYAGDAATTIDVRDVSRAKGNVQQVEQSMEFFFEARRLYVAPRKSVLFFARIGDEKIRCYVQQNALIEPARGLREESDVFQRCLLAFDQHRRAIESAAKRLIEANRFDGDGGVTISRAALALEAEPPLVALGTGDKKPAAARKPQQSRQAKGHKVEIARNARKRA